MGCEIFMLAFTMLALTGCAPGYNDPNPEGDPALKSEVLSPLYCDGDEQCKEYWQKSQLWISQNSAWRIQTVTDTIISTYPPLDPYPWRTAYQVTKEPLGKGKYQIKITPYCQSVFFPKCSPKIFPAVFGFKRYVSGSGSYPLNGN